MASYQKKTRSKDPSYKRRRSNAPDTQLTYPIAKPSPVTGATGQVQVPQLLSATGHRLYRQHGSYMCKINLMSAATSVPEIKVFALANHWYVKRAIQTAKEMYDQAVADERALVTEGRWNDFRIQADNSTGVELLGTIGSATTAGAGTPLTSAGEYSFSRIRDAAGNTKAFRLEGASGAGHYNIFEEYDNMGNTARDPQQASPATVGGYDGVHETVDEQNASDLVIRGNDPPYHSTNLHDDVFVQVGSLFRDTNGNQRLSTGFFSAPLGMIFLSYQGGPAENPTLELELKGGNYKGVSMEAY